MEQKERRALIVVDPQYDFINGSLPVPGAEQAMDALAKYVKENDGRWCHKVVTYDCHPANHCSFVTQGGPWPVHCVAKTKGCDIYAPLDEALKSTRGFLEGLMKGNYADKEEYSIMQNWVSATLLDGSLSPDCVSPYTDIDVCGIAGDVCVLNTLRDLVERYGTERLHVLTDFCPSLDGGKALADYIKEVGIDEIRSK